MKIRFASLAMLLVLGVMGSATQMSAQQQVRLRARTNKTVLGVETELRGDYRERGGPIRLNSELENINMPAGTPVAFCLLKDGVKSLLGVGHVVISGGRPFASVELEANDGDTVPSVDAGNVLEAHQRLTKPFNPKPTCGSVLIISAPFQK